VNLNDTLPAGVTFISALPSQGFCSENGGIVTCQLSTLAPGEIASVTLLVAPMAAGNLTNTVSVSGADFDPVTANNTVSATTLVLSPPFITASAAKSIGHQRRRGLDSGDRNRNGPFGLSMVCRWLAVGWCDKLHADYLQCAVVRRWFLYRAHHQLGGSVTSAPAVLTVLVSPAFVTQPQSLTNLAGSTAVFSSAATGTAPLGYQWWFNATNALPGATAPTLTLPAVDLTNAGSYRVVVSNAAGVLTSALATLTVIRVDFGDAPAGYPTALADDGARHRLVPGVRLGNAIDAESDAITNPPGLGDDGNGVDDEDGVFFTTSLRVGQTAGVSVVASTNGVLNAWLDFGRDGSWAETGDQIFTNRNLTTGTNNLSFLIPAGINPGFSYARFRFSTTTGLFTSRRGGERRSGRL
jgi:hypothetical protein